MQTFLPYPNFAVSLMHLDYKRLGKQRVETRQMQKAIQEVERHAPMMSSTTVEDWRERVKFAETSIGLRRIAWSLHPCTLMWRNNLLALMLYGDCCIVEWVARGYNNTMPLMMTSNAGRITGAMKNVEMPHWLGDEEFHLSHQSNLLRKDPEFYGQFDWQVTPDMEYVWPTKEKTT